MSKKADEFAKAQLTQKAFKQMKNLTEQKQTKKKMSDVLQQVKGFVPREVAKIEGKPKFKNLREAVQDSLKTPKPPSQEKPEQLSPLRKPPINKKKSTIQTFFEPVVKDKFTKKEGTKKEVYEGVAKYHKANGVKKYKQDITLRNNKAALK